MITEIKTYQDLKNALEQLTPDQLNQPIRNSKSFYGENTIESIEIQEYDYYENISNDEDFGTLEELKETHGDSFIIENYKNLIPKGTVLIN